MNQSFVQYYQEWIEFREERLRLRRGGASFEPFG